MMGTFNIGLRKDLRSQLIKSILVSVSTRFDFLHSDDYGVFFFSAFLTKLFRRRRKLSP